MSKKLDIIGLFLSNYSISFSGREIARKINVSAQTALTALNNLVKEKVLNQTKEGRNYKYSLIKDNFQTKQLITLAEDLSSYKSLARFELKTVIEMLLPFASTIIVFGSFAKGVEKEHSDLDLIIIEAKDKQKVRSKLRTFAREINLEFTTWSSFSKALFQGNNLAKEIKKNHLIYGNVLKVVDLYCR